ncbi:class I SAM-dependent methyltransferase [Mycobacterium sp. DL440]|uniref:class I SAM-dependent methyltransferase n=1 Tax=Mycobacterium sp. DL440 TaxID=2675523 RepID=UPI00141F4B68|nr:class I SAM-dependent methyltransferase [Mycobacterium sp. DL440]
MSVIDGNTLDGVSATSLWTLSNRGLEARRSDGVIRDPWAVALRDSIDYDYDKFGRPTQAHALRARAFDVETRDYLSTHPKAAVVALAEGLQTSFWRLDQAEVAGELTWYSVDLPPVIAIRDKLLPHDDRMVALAQSALDRSWMDRVDAEGGVCITAEGLLMYLEPADVRTLIADCAARFPGGRMVFDSIPHWVSRHTLKGLHLSNRYTAPPMPFALTADEGLAMAGTGPGAIAGVRSARDVPMQAGRGLFKLAAEPWLDRIGAIHRIRPSITALDF